MSLIKNIATALLILGVAALTGVQILSERRSAEQPVGAIQFHSFDSIATSAAKAVTAGAGGRILATSSARSYALFVNMCTTPVFLGIDSDKAAVASSGVPLLTYGASYEILPNENLYTGAVTATTSAGCVIAVTEARY